MPQKSIRDDVNVDGDDGSVTFYRRRDRQPFFRDVLESPHAKTETEITDDETRHRNRRSRHFLSSTSSTFFFFLLELVLPHEKLETKSAGDEK